MLPDGCCCSRSRYRTRSLLRLHMCRREGHITLELTDAMPSFDEVVQAAREQREPEGWSEDPYEVRVNLSAHNLAACAVARRAPPCIVLLRINCGGHDVDPNSGIPWPRM